MPNHFHFLILATKKSVLPRVLGSLTSNELSNGFRITQSQYAQCFNEKYRLTGTVFKQKPKSKCLNDGSHDYSWTCFTYIHQNPVKARLCKSAFEWPYSSAIEIKRGQHYFDSLVNLSVLKQYLGIESRTIELSLTNPSADHAVRKIF